MNANERVIKNGCVPVALGGYHHQEEEPSDSADVKEKTWFRRGAAYCRLGRKMVNFDQFVRLG